MLITIESIKQKLQSSSLFPNYLEVKDDSSGHEEHLDVEKGSVTHLTIIISSEKFKGLPRVKAHQAIYEVLKEEIAAGLHAISIKIL